MSKKKFSKIIIGSCFLVLVFLAFISWQAVIETENWKWFDLDYTNKNQVLSGYSALLSATFSSLSIILLVYTIYLQNRESRLQSKRFKKEYRLQKEQFEENKHREERKERSRKLSVLKIVSVFLESIIKHIEETGVELKNYVAAEKQNPLGFNMLYFLVNKVIGKFVEMDYQIIFNSYDEFFDDDDWPTEFQQLLNSVGFYNDALLELRANYTSHSKEKQSRKLKISNDLKELMDSGAKILNKYKESFDHHLEYPYARLINELIREYYDILGHDEKSGNETNFDVISGHLLYNFVKGAMDIRIQLPFDNLGIEEMVSMASSIRKEIWRLRFDCEHFAKNNQLRYDSFFSQDSENLRRLKLLKRKIDDRINNINV